MTEFDNLVLMIVSGYLLVGYLIYRWIRWMLNDKYAKDWRDEDRDTYEHALSMVSTMVAWPRIIWGPLKGLVRGLAVLGWHTLKEKARRK